MKNMIHLERSTIPFDILEEIIALGEGYKTEFHTLLPALTKVAQTVCAFSNTKGGNLFIGISKNGSPVGVQDKYSEVSKIDEALSLLHPQPDFSVQLVNFKDGEIMLIRVKEGNKKPYFVRHTTGTNAYIRVGEANVLATKRSLKAFMKKDTRGNGQTKKRETINKSIDHKYNL